MLTGIELLQLGFTEGQLIELFLNPDHGVQCRFRFERQINRLILLTIRIEQLFRTVQVIFDLGKMGLQEIQALLDFFGLAQHVLLEIVLADVIEHSTNTSLVFPFQGQGDDPGILALLADLKTTLQLANHIKQRLLDQGKYLAILCGNVCDKQGHILFFQQLAHLSFQHPTFHLQGETVFSCQGQGEGGANQLGSHLETTNRHLGIGLTAHA